MNRVLRLAFAATMLALPLGCTAAPANDAGVDQSGGDNGGDPNAGGNCGDDDPLTNENWVGFCADRVDDNCQVEDETTPCPTTTGTHNYCNTGDEACPSTQPGSAPPAWDCLGTPPSNVVAFGYHADANNPNVVELCVFVYESEAAPGEHYVAYSLVDGPSPFGPPSPPVNPAADCNADRFARRHLFLSDLDGGACDGVTYIHAYPQENPTGELYPVDDQKLSNDCRKMMKNISFGGSGFTPEVQYFAASRGEALAKLAVLDTAEVACIGIDNIDNEPYRATERWYVQAVASLQLVSE